MSGDPKLSRREFVSTTAAAGAFAALGPLVRHASPSDAALPAVRAEIEIDEATIAQLQEGMRAGTYTARQIAERYIARIREKDGDLHSVLELNPDALAIADALDAERKAKGPRGPMHGIPVLIKDNVATADKMQTCAGSLALVGAGAPRDAFVARKLRESGAVILGKTNLSEWANFRSTHSSSGWSGRGGQCRNPYALDRTPSGSSSGSGVAIASDFCAAAIGTETNGSIVAPSSACSLVGIKPTVGLVSRAGIIPIAHSQDTAGPMTRTVADAAALLSAIAGVDARDPATRDAAPHVAPDYTKFLDPNGLRGKRIGIPRDHYYGYSDVTDGIAQSAIDVMKAQGAVIVDPADIPTAATLGKSEFDVLLYEFKADLDAYLADLGPKAPVHTLAELIAWNDAHRAEELPWFNQDILIMAQKKGPLSDEKYKKALADSKRLAGREGIDAVMEKHRLDALVAPTSSPPWLIDLVNGDADNGGGCSSPAAIAGYPHITVPAGYAFGLPVGISFFGRAWSEPVLIAMAYAYEQASKMRRPPGFARTAELRAG